MIMKCCYSYVPCCFAVEIIAGAVAEIIVSLLLLCSLLLIDASVLMLFFLLNLDPGLQLLLLDFSLVLFAVAGVPLFLLLLLLICWCAVAAIA